MLSSWRTCLEVEYLNEKSNSQEVLWQRSTRLGSTSQKGELPISPWGCLHLLLYPTIFYPLDSRVLRLSSTFDMHIVLYSLNLIFCWVCLHSFSPGKCRLYPHPHILPHKSCSILLFLTQTNCIICFFLAIKVILLHDATLLPNLFLHRLNTRWMRTTTQAGRTSWWLMIIDSILLVKKKI